MQDKVSFNFAKANDLVLSLASCKEQFNTAFTNFDNEIKSMSEWWEGESLMDFQDRCAKVTKDLSAYMDIIDDVAAYVSRVSTEKERFEKNSKSKF